jgi:membrane-associated phospholipid phosphatase
MNNASHLAHHTVVSGVPEGSLSARRIEPWVNGPSEQLAPRLRRAPSLLVSWLVADLSTVALAGLMIVLGFFVTEVLLRIGAVSRADNWLPEWLAAHRTGLWNHWSYVGSMIGDAPVLIPVAGAVAIFLALRGRWRTASFVVQAGLAEALAYFLTVLFVKRMRPNVVHLDHYSLNHSFPSGHVAAAIAVYGAIALLLTAHFRARRAQLAIFLVAAILPAIVAASRMYRGEHHPIDVLGGALMGVGALVVALFAVRTARAVAELREESHSETFSA